MIEKVQRIVEKGHGRFSCTEQRGRTKMQTQRVGERIVAVVDNASGRTMEQLRVAYFEESLSQGGDVAGRLARIEATAQACERMLSTLVQQRTIKDWYTTKEIATLLGKKEYTVREWCRLRRINSKKLSGGRGNEGEWRISHEELLRIQTEGLLPIPLQY
jgi:hypothetical protein